ncbi:MAG: stress response translation initiation inhibitor YciH [Oscillatoriales cyanobacterium SM2_1_8]|nr:stress response translation initiation inhibitor YciH [Oscillatoriales cyanobacterium SM2_1_8]
MRGDSAPGTLIWRKKSTPSWVPNFREGWAIVVDKTVYREFGGEPAEPEPAAESLSRAAHPVRVGRSRKGRGGKTVTVVSGFLGPAPQVKAELTALLKTLKTKLGTGGTVADNTLEIQGDRQEDVVKLLTELGYRAKASG